MEHATRDVLERTRTLLGLRSLTLRRVAAAVPEQRRRVTGGCVLDVPVRLDGRLAGVLTATSALPFTSAEAELLGSLAELLALSMGDGASSSEASRDACAAGLEILDEEADRAQTAADLEGVVEAVVALSHVGPADLPESIGAALTQVRSLQRELRALSLETGLRHALSRLDAEVKADDPSLDELAPPVAVALQRIAEAVVRAADGSVRITANVTGTTVKLRAELADNGIDAFELTRWSRRVHALGGNLRQQPEGVEVSLPARPATTKDDSDDSPHL